MMQSLMVSLPMIAVLIRIIVNPLSNVFQKQLTQRSVDPLFITSATYGGLSLVCLCFWPQLRFTGLPYSFWQSMFITGVFAMLGNVFLVKALKIGNLSVLGPINAYKSVVGLIMGLILLNEVPTRWGIIGVLLIVVGSYIVLVDWRQRSAFSWNIFLRPDVKLRVLALVFSAIDGAFLKKAILLSSPTIAFFYWCLLGFVFTFVWILSTERSEVRPQIKLLAFHKLTFIGLLLTIGISQLASNIALATIPVGYALAFFQMSALINVFFGYHFFQEQGLLRKLVGATVMVIGAILIVGFS